MKKKKNKKPFWNTGTNPITGYKVETLDKVEHNHINKKKATW